MTDTVTTKPDTGAFVHPALFYQGPQEYLTGVGGFVRAAVEAEEPVLVAVPGTQLTALRNWLGEEAEAVDFADMTVLGRNPGRILASLLGFADQHRGRPVRIVGEQTWPGRSPAETLEAVRHEALINTAFARRHATILCPFSVSGVPAGVVADARRTHPTLIHNGRDQTSDAYVDPAEVCTDCDQPLSPPPASGVLTVNYSTDQLASVREQATSWATDATLDRTRAGDLVLAISEAAANSLAHGGGHGTLRLWATASGTVIAEISDTGHLIDPLAGRSRPTLASANGGRGLWMIHQLCDLVETRATPAGLTLRLHLTP
ncbi:anti-sigma factor RsbA family regulatory protein [Streptacidiphilus sp. PAMC 29251]